MRLPTPPDYDDYCCACITDGECDSHPEHVCGLSEEEIAQNKARQELLFEAYTTLQLGEAKFVPGLEQWVSYSLEPSLHDGRTVRTFKTYDERPEGFHIK